MQRLAMIQRVNKSETWYEATAPRGEALAAPAGIVEADVCVIGGGLAGLTAALELQRRGKQVALLEAARIAGGASGRNGGFVFNGFARGIAEVAAIAGLDRAKALYSLSKHGTEYVRREVASLAPEATMGEGVLLALRVDDPDALKRRQEMMKRDYDEVMEVRSTAETRALLRSSRYHQSIAFPRALQIHPLRYALALAAEARKRGARLFENAAALAVERRQSGFAVRTASGEIRCEHIVHCVSALDRQIHGVSGRAVLPVATYIAVTEPLNQDAIATRIAIADTRRAGNYYRLIDEGRILWGGMITTRVGEPRLLARQMKRDLLSVFPQLGDPKIDYAWSGIMGYALHKMPLIGRSADGQFYATAFGGHGLNTTAMAGILIARAIADGDDEYRRFAPFAPRWAGGPFGRAGVQGSYWWMQLRDRIDEAKSARRLGGGE
jgi:glycine/D-amino acid oxidase-like deaminating enzyme